MPAGANSLRSRVTMYDQDDTEQVDTERDDAPHDGAPEQEPEDGHEPPEGEGEEGDDEGETVITLPGDAPAPDDEEPEEPESPTFRDLRQRNREMARELKALKQAKDQGAAPAPTPKLERPRKPRMDDDDVQFDDDKLAAALDKWAADTRAYETQEAAATKAKADADKAWQTTLDGYSANKAKLKVPDFDDAEQAVRDTLNDQQRGLILEGAENAAAVVYALGTRPDLAKKLAAETNPVKFVAAIARLEKDMTLTRKPSKPETRPESALRGDRPVGVKGDQTLAKLEAEAERTGDRSKVIAHKRAARDKAG